MKISKLFLFLFLFQLNAFSQPPIEVGVATFEFSYPDAGSISPQAYVGLMKGLKIYFKNGKSREEYSNEARWVNIIDSKRKEILGMGTPEHNIADVMTFKEKEENQAIEFGKYDVKITDETKEIAGYKCKKAIITYKGLITPIKTRTMEVWFTNQIRAMHSYFFKGIDGFIMEYTHLSIFTEDDFLEVLTCTKVEKAKVSDDMFKLPKDCKVETWKDVNKNSKIEVH